MKKIFNTLLVLACGIFIISRSSMAQQHEYAPDIRFNACMDRANRITVRMVECENNAYDMWNDHLNRYYSELMSMLNPQQRLLLKNQDIAWLRYVKARMNFDTNVLATGGIMDQINFADKQRHLIRRRRTIYLMNAINTIKQNSGN